MRLIELAIPGPTIVEPELLVDDRGCFARTFDRAEFAGAAMEPMVEQCNLSFNHLAGTLRGMHFQIAPAPEAKLVRCTRGGIVDIVVDVRPDSATYLQHVAVELTAENRLALYVPPFFAHGYQTPMDASEVSYQVSSSYTPGAERGLRYSDPDLDLPWPLPVSVVSDKDSNWPLLAEGGLG